MESADACSACSVVTEVAAVTTCALVSSGTERPVTLARQNDDTNGDIFSRPVECLGEFDERLWAKRVVNLGSTDRELRNGGGVLSELREFVANVLEPRVLDEVPLGA